MTVSGVELAGRVFRFRHELGEDANAQNLMRSLSGLKRALRIFHALGDEIVDVDDAGRIYEAARHPKNVVSLHGADYLLTPAEE